MQTSDETIDLGREFLFKNELKVYYSKTGECRLDYKQEELVATVDSQDTLTLTLKSGIYIPGRTVAILNVIVLYIKMILDNSIMLELIHY